MSRMKSKLAATLLTLAFAMPVSAGNIGSPGGSTPPPPPPLPEGTVVNASAQTPEALGSLGLESSLIDILLAVISLT